MSAIIADLDIIQESSLAVPSCLVTVGSKPDITFKVFEYKTEWIRDVNIKWIKTDKVVNITYAKVDKPTIVAKTEYFNAMLHQGHWKEGTKKLIELHKDSDTVMIVICGV